MAEQTEKTIQEIAREPRTAELLQAAYSPDPPRDPNKKGMRLAGVGYKQQGFDAVVAHLRGTLASSVQCTLEEVEFAVKRVFRRPDFEPHKAAEYLSDVLDTIILASHPSHGIERRDLEIVIARPKPLDVADWEWIPWEHHNVPMLFLGDVLRTRVFAVKSCGWPSSPYGVYLPSSHTMNVSHGGRGHYVTPDGELTDYTTRLALEAKCCSALASAELHARFTASVPPLVRALEQTRPFGSDQDGRFVVAEGVLADPAPVVQEEQELLRRLLQTMWYRPPKKHRMQHRLRNALLLFVAAENDSDLLGLAGYVAAVEALLCRKTSDAGLTTMLSQNAAALLQPDPSMRPIATKAVKKLYQHRCDLVHGNDPAGESASGLWREMAKRFAIATIRGVVMWMRTHDRIDQEAHSEDDYFEMLREAFEGGTAVTGVESYLQYLLPRLPDRP